MHQIPNVNVNALTLCELTHYPTSVPWLLIPAKNPPRRRLGDEATAHPFASSSMQKKVTRPPPPLINLFLLVLWGDGTVLGEGGGR